MSQQDNDQVTRMETAKKAAGKPYDFRVVDVLDFSGTPPIAPADLTPTKRSK